MTSTSSITISIHGWPENSVVTLFDCCKLQFISVDWTSILSNQVPRPILESVILAGCLTELRKLVPEYLAYKKECDLNITSGNFPSASWSNKKTRRIIKTFWVELRERKVRKEEEKRGGIAAMKRRLVQMRFESWFLMDAREKVSFEYATTRALIWLADDHTWHTPSQKTVLKTWRG